MKTSYKGQCLCGSITFEVDKIQKKMGHCHCSMCRKFHGAAYATYGEARSEHFNWLSGEKRLKTYEAYNGTRRQFCSTCGSSLRFIPSNDTGEFVEFALGALDTNIPHKPDAHVYTKYGANWCEISDQLPRFEEGRKS